MESKEYLENLALKKSILPVCIYLLVVGSLFYAIDKVSVGANSFLGVDNLKVVNILKALLIGLLTIFLIFYLVYKYKFMEVNTHLNTVSIVQNSPYPEIVCQVNDYAIAACSQPLLSILGYSSNEIRSMLLRDILSTKSMNVLVELFKDNTYASKDFTDIHFIGKNKGLLSLSVHCMKFEILDNDYVILRCYQSKILANTAIEGQISSGNISKRNFQF